jgi:hypothetical protein
MLLILSGKNERGKTKSTSIDIREMDIRQNIHPLTLEKWILDKIYTN